MAASAGGPERRVYWKVTKLDQILSVSMAGRVAIITDSTASLPPALAAKLGIVVVPLTVHIGERTLDEDRVNPDDVLDAFERKVPVSTSPPVPPAFYWAYQDALAQGADTILSFHISEKLSRTCESARLAAAQIAAPVHIVDTRNIAMAIGYLAVAAAEAALSGADLREIAAVVEHRRANSLPFFYVDTLEYLHRGGRIGKAAALLGTALSMKPLLTMEDGQIAPITRVRRSDRALGRLEEIALDWAGQDPVDIAVHHVAAADGAGQLSDRLRDRFPTVGGWCVNPVSWVLGIHVGPGMLGVVVSKR
jgi:DegV family protein with EDD domain